VPAVTNPASVTPLIGDTVTLSFTFDNMDTIETGYGPFIDLYLPTRGISGSPNFDGVILQSVSAFSPPMNPTIFTVPITAANSGCVNHPFAVDDTHTPLTVCGVAGDTLLSIVLPFGSFTPNQPTVPIDVQLQVSNLANAGAALNIYSRAGFEYGATPLDDPCCDETIVNPVASQNRPITDWGAPISITPRPATFTKRVVQANMNQGPNFPNVYILTTEFAPGSFTSFSISDTLPTTIIYRGNAITTPSGVTCTVTTAPAVNTRPNAGPAPNFIVTCNPFTISNVGDTLSITINFYVPYVDASSSLIIEQDELSTPFTNSATLTTSFRGQDPRDASVPISIGAPGVGASTNVLLISKSVRELSTGNSFLPGSSVEFTIIQRTLSDRIITNANCVMHEL